MYSFKRASRIAVFAVALTALTSVASAAVSEMHVYSTTQGTYVGDVSASDLLQGLTPAVSNWNTTINASPLELTDGIHGAKYNVYPTDKVQGAWTKVGATAEYNLGTGTNGLGYDLTSIVSIADWENVSFGNQAWKIEVKAVDAGSYTTLAIVNYQPITGLTATTGIGGTKVTLTDTTGLLASGVQYIKITANSVNGGANAGAFVWRELDVFGTPTPEPASLGLLALGGLAVLRRRVTAGRR